MYSFIFFNQFADYKKYLSSCIFLFIFDDLFSFGNGLLTIGPGSVGGIMPIQMADIDMQMTELLHVA